MKFAFAAVLLFLLGGSIVCEDSCGSFRDARGRSSIDVAPLPGFSDVCSRDFQLCVMLTQGYPPSVQTIGYFVPVEDWERYQKGQHKGFSRYLIAQKGRTLSKEEFAEFKQYVHSQQGNISDHTKLASLFESRGQVSLGIVDETSDSISIGSVVKLTETALKRKLQTAAINIVLQIKGESLSLYVYDDAKGVNDTERVKDLAKRWIQCIRNQNSK